MSDINITFLLLPFRVYCGCGEAGTGRSFNAQRVLEKYEVDKAGEEEADHCG